MNHPKPEEWVSYLYSESRGDARQQLKAHLHECAQCREEVETWRRSMHQLDTWKVPRPHRISAASLAPALKWAFACIAVLLTGVLIGRASAPRVDTEELRRALLTQVHQDLDSRIAQVAQQELARAAAVSTASSRRYTDQVAQQLYVVVKKDIDTLALNAEAGFRHTAQQLVQLADYTQPAPDRLQNDN